MSIKKNINRHQSVVTKLPEHPLIKPQSRPQASSHSSSRASSSTPAEESWNPQVQSVMDLINPMWSKEMRLRHLVRYFGHFNVEADSEWTQAEVDAEVARKQEHDRVNANRNMQTTFRNQLKSVWHSALTINISELILLFPT